MIREAVHPLLESPDFPRKLRVDWFCKIHSFRQEGFKKTGKELKIGRQRHSIRQKIAHLYLRYTHIFVEEIPEVRLAIYNG